VFCQAGSYGKAVVMPDLGDLSVLVKEDGYKGGFSTRKYRVSGRSHKSDFK
jgi:hypothetical protein